ncbi:hypothetical protein EYF80_058770 [Liparis tanakae]|uniref:Uncharacterized protein n=1 Tax=Liparis tanakae TaxID=230148 RepID=A0A4Z2EQG3_9TELE|nr:hypothetical protein EYF80_058770 [Liparis tanakae]
MVRFQCLIISTVLQLSGRIPSRGRTDKLRVQPVVPLIAERTAASCATPPEPEQLSEENSWCCDKCSPRGSITGLTGDGGLAKLRWAYRSTAMSFWLASRAMDRAVLPS